MEPFDPFAVLGLPRQYDLDAAAVQRAYLERSAQVHPDVSGADDDEDDRASELNRAKQILDDPEQRAIALWKLLGGGGVGAVDKTLPPGFLMQMMEVREEVEAAARMEGPGGKEARRKWEAWAEDRRREYQGRVGALFARAETHSPPAADPILLKQIKTELNAWRYIERLIEQL